MAIAIIALRNATPYVISSKPANNDTDVSITTPDIETENIFIPAFNNPGRGLENNTVNNATVRLQKLAGSSWVDVQGIAQSRAHGVGIRFTPAQPLEPGTEYRFKITKGVKSAGGTSFMPYQAIFRTAPDSAEGIADLKVRFAKVPMAGTQNKQYTTLTFGPDGKLYALRLDGVIERFTVNHADGRLSSQQLITTVVDMYGPRSAIGLAFAPEATADNLLAYVSHSSAGFQDAPDFDGKISRLRGADLETEQLVVTKLPRSTKDHMVNSLVFGPDGALYFAVGSNSAMGGYDRFWARAESLLSAAVLRLDLTKLKGIRLPLDVQTTANQRIINKAPANAMFMADGSYNPYAASSPLTIYASGVRNAYDLLWHSNGQLYIPDNGASAGGRTPASVAGTRRVDGTFYHGDRIRASSSAEMQSRWIYRKLKRFTLVKTLFPELNTAVQKDWLLRVNPSKPVGYYGHPNPLRGEYVAGRGHVDNPSYPVSVKPDANYRMPAYDFGLNKSPDGLLEYKNGAFGGALKGKIMVCRFSGGSDIMVLEPGKLVKDTVAESKSDEEYDIVRAASGTGTKGLKDLSDFANPIDIVEDTTTGNLYVSEFNWQQDPEKTAQITLLRVNEEAPEEGIAAHATN
nr:Ig-like domain-containing protein [Pontibacter liquoris]